MHAILVQDCSQGIFAVNDTPMRFNLSARIIKCDCESQEQAEVWLLQNEWQKLDPSATPANPAYRIWKKSSGPYAMIVPII